MYIGLRAQPRTSPAHPKSGPGIPSVLEDILFALFACSSHQDDIGVREKCVPTSDGRNGCCLERAMPGWPPYGSATEAPHAGEAGCRPRDRVGATARAREPRV